MAAGSVRSPRPGPAEGDVGDRGHVERCEDCDRVRIAYNSCRNRHCPKCQAAAAQRWLEARQAELLPLAYYHVVFTLPAQVALDDRGVTFRWKDYRQDGQARRKLMTLTPGEFLRRFLIHVLPSGFHRIRHYGLFANTGRAANLAKARALLQAPPPSEPDASAEPDEAAKPPIACPCCGGRMILVEVFARGGSPHSAPPRPVFRIDSS